MFMTDRRGFVLWFTGLSGAGKSTLSELLAPRLRHLGLDVEVLDGDEVRTHLSKGLGFSREDRDTNILRIAYVAKLLARNGVAVVTAAISPYRATRDAARAMIEAEGLPFLEVYLAASLEACEARDVKGLYAEARQAVALDSPGSTTPTSRRSARNFASTPAPSPSKKVRRK